MTTDLGKVVRWRVEIRKDGGERHYPVFVDGMRLGAYFEVPLRLVRDTEWVARQRRYWEGQFGGRVKVGGTLAASKAAHGADGGADG